MLDHTHFATVSLDKCLLAHRAAGCLHSTKDTVDYLIYESAQI